MQLRPILGAVLLALSATGCGDLTEAPPVDERELGSPADTGAAPGAAPQSTGRDLSGVDLCQLLPVDEVAEITDRRLGGVASRQDLMATQGCAYGVTVVGGPDPDRLSIWAQPPELFEGEEALVANAQSLEHEVSTEPVEGLGDRAFVLSNATLGIHTVHVLRDGDVALHATAEDPQQAIAMVQLALERLGAPPPV